MAVKTEKELSEASRALWLKAVAAIELRNFGYAISLLQEILTQEPQFLTGRELLRRASSRLAGDRSFRAAHAGRRESPRRQGAARAWAFVSSTRRQRPGGGNL